jgi:hypothetical protein
VTIIKITAPAAVLQLRAYRGPKTFEITPQDGIEPLGSCGLFAVTFSGNDVKGA